MGVRGQGRLWEVIGPFLDTQSGLCEVCEGMVSGNALQHFSIRFSWQCYDGGLHIISISFSFNKGNFCNIWWACIYLYLQRKFIYHYIANFSAGPGDILWCLFLQGSMSGSYDKSINIRTKLFRNLQACLQHIFQTWAHITRLAQLYINCVNSDID